MKTNLVLPHLGALGILTMIHLLIYAAVQKSYRACADNPQQAIVNDISHLLTENEPVDKYFSYGPTDLTWSTSPFVVLYDSSLKPVRYSARVMGQPPQLPEGVLQQAANQKDYAVSWTASKNLKLAMVLKHIPRSPVAFVAAGRSLRDVELRSAQMLKMVFFSWVICVVILGCNWVVTTKPQSI